MDWIYAVFSAGLGALLVILLGSFFAFCYIFLRGGRDEDFFCRNHERRGKDLPQVRQMRESRVWYHAQNREIWHIRSFDGTRLVADFLPAQGYSRGTVIFCHGWRSTGPTDFSCAFRDYYTRGFDLLVIDQRGHHRSGGTWLGFGVLEAKDVLHWVQEVNRRQGEAHPIILHGMSMGAATVQYALDLPLPDNVKGAVADCGFSSPWEQLAYVLENKAFPVRPTLALLNMWARLLAGYGLKDCHTADIMQRNRRPVLWLHGQRDKMVPCTMSEQAHAAAICEKWLVTVPDAGHELASLVAPDACREALDAFLQCCLQDCLTQ